MITPLRSPVSFAFFGLSSLVFACSSAPSSPSAGSSAAASSKECRSSDKPAACPGGGEAHCESGTWECSPLPTACDSSDEPAACPGGGVPHCSRGVWECSPLPGVSGDDAGASCDPTQEPAACPGGGSPQCNGGQWACAPLPSCVPDGSASQQQGADCCSGNYDPNSGNCGQPAASNGCDPSQEPAACPGGGSPQCNSGQWACAPLPTCVPDGSQSQEQGADCCSGSYDPSSNNCGQAASNGCDPSQEPAACPGGGSPQCSGGQWACAPLPSCVPDGSQSQEQGADCCSGNYDSNTNNCGQ